MLFLLKPYQRRPLPAATRPDVRKGKRKKKKRYKIITKNRKPVATPIEIDSGQIVQLVAKKKRDLRVKRYESLLRNLDALGLFD